MYLFYEQMNVENKKRVSETEGRRVYICTSIYKDIWKKESLSKFIFSWTLFPWLQNDFLLTTSVWLKHCFFFFFEGGGICWQHMLLPTDSRIKQANKWTNQTFWLVLKNAIPGYIQHYWITRLYLTLQLATHLTTFCSLSLVIFLCLTL